jgi:hypothetical protein
MIANPIEYDSFCALILFEFGGFERAERKSGHVSLSLSASFAYPHCPSHITWTHVTLLSSYMEASSSGMWCLLTRQWLFGEVYIP